MKKEIIIVSADSILPYQPSILNLYDCLAEKFNVRIISFQQNFITKQKIEKKNIIYLSNQTIAYKVCRLIDLYTNFFLKRISKILPSFHFRMTCVKYFQVILIKKCIRKLFYDELIAVDFIALKASHQLSVPCHLLSLEIIENDNFRRRVNINLIKKVLIQSEIRFHYLFPNKKPDYYFLPNSTNYKKIKLPNHKKNLLWQGSILKIFGVESCLKFIQQQDKYTLTLRGGIEKKFLLKIKKEFEKEFQSGRISINNEYINDVEFLNFVSNFKIGFCFYDWTLIKNNFNYRTAPSGKLFMYLLAGVPVIACDIEGFQFIKENKCGVLIKDYAFESIQNAINIIEENYETYETNAIKIAEQYDFKKYANLFRDTL